MELSTLYLLAAKIMVIVCDSGLCRRVSRHVTLTECCCYLQIMSDELLLVIQVSVVVFLDM